MLRRPLWTLARRKWTQRGISSLVHVGREVKSAVASGSPVVALESTIITHGMPFPRNLETALSVESIIRKHGAVPATIGCLHGKLHVGMTVNEIEALAKSASPAKISRRDFAVVTARRLSGGTTIAGTMVLAHMAGIKVFATGGLGGVHRGGELSMDVSADLEELGRTPVAVISSGAKAILDLPRTLEYLETKGVTVTTLGEEGVDIPAFYSSDSGIRSPFNSSSIEDAARLIHANLSLGLDSGIAIFNPIPAKHSIPREEMEVVIEEAVRECVKLGIIGKDVTPFLLKRVVEATKGRSLSANIALIEDNARVGAQIAVALASLDSNSTSFHSSEKHHSQTTHSTHHSSHNHSPRVPPTDIMVIGSMAVDLTCTFPLVSSHSMQLHTSHPSKIHTSAGGVAHNIALASTYASPNSVRLVTAIGSDPEGTWLRSYSETVGLDVEFISSEGGTARYIAMHDRHGELIVAAADMGIVEGFKAEDLQRVIRHGKPKFLAFDGNLSGDSIKTILEECPKETRVLFEPTSVPKASAIFRKPIELGLFPKHSINIVTPNIFELEAIYAAAQANGHFEGAEWWSIVDNFQVTSQFRQDVESLLRKLDHQHTSHSTQFDQPHLTEIREGPGDQVEFDHEEVDLIKSGIVQQSIGLLPYFPNILIKLGARGILGVRLCPKANDTDRDSNRLRLQGRDVDLVVQHYPGLQHQQIVSVTGAGDTFSGVLMAQLVAGTEIDDAVNIAQKAAIMTLSSPYAVSEEIRHLKIEHINN